MFHCYGYEGFFHVNTLYRTFSHKGETILRIICNNLHAIMVHFTEGKKLSIPFSKRLIGSAPVPGSNPASLNLQALFSSFLGLALL